MAVSCSVRNAEVKAKSTAFGLASPSLDVESSVNGNAKQ